MSCLAFLRPKSAYKDKNAYRLPDFDEACASASRQGCKIGSRTFTICGRLLPVGCCIFGHNFCQFLCCGQPRIGVKNAKRIKRQFETLGPSFIKLGQAMSAREDVLGPAVSAELRKLCDQVVPIPLEQARCLLEEDLGSKAPLLEDEPVATASLGQVYRIKVGDQDLAMKIQRPLLAQKLAIDVVILMKAATFFNRIRTCKLVDYVQIVRDWAQTLWQELDYEHEGRRQDYMHKQLTGRVPGLIIPRVHWPLSGTRVLATQWVQGMRLTDSLSKISSKHIATGVDAFASMVLDIGVVHADPHAGNVLITKDDKVCLLDFGMIIEMPEEHRIAWAKCVCSMNRKDHAQTLDNLVALGFFPQDCPRGRILEFMPRIWAELVDSGSDIDKRKLAVQKCRKDIITMVRELEFALPDYYLAFARAVIELEGIAVAADAQFDIFKAVLPHAVRYLAEQRPL